MAEELVLAVHGLPEALVDRASFTSIAHVRDAAGLEGAADEDDVMAATGPR